VSTITTEKSRAVKLAITPGNDAGSLAVSATSSENGTAVEELEVHYLNEPLEIGFNSRYLLDIAAQIEGEDAQFMMADSASPTIVRDCADRSALYVLMPMRV
jgi:DNA polymerase-3 subunit beta